LLGIGDETVRSHLKKVQAKLGVRNRAHAAEIFRLVAEGKLRPAIDDVLPFDRAREALERLEQRKVKGKLVLVPSITA
jgi:NADPH:quinone reductase-like Zn-dependent oxidoreductase